MQPVEALRVLIIDDHVMFAEGLRDALQAYEDVQVVGIAHSAREGERIAKAEVPDVVLLDFGLPDSTGAAAARRIRDAHPEIKVVMVSALVDEAVVLKAIEAGCSGFVTKDRPVGALVDAVRSAHAGEALIDPAMLRRLLPRLRRDYRGFGSDLTNREIEVLKLLAEGRSNHDIASTLVLSLNTVRKHVQNILSKLHAHSKLEAVAVAVREGLVDFPRR